MLFILVTLSTIPFVNANVKEELQPELSYLNKDYNLVKYKIFLPLTIKVVSDEEEFLLVINKLGDIEFVDKGKVDITIQGKEEDLTNILNSNYENFKGYVGKVNVYGNSFKGKVAVLIAEKITKTKFNKNKSFNDKILGAVIYPITLFFN